jgi:hypothetical protein
MHSDAGRDADAFFSKVAHAKVAAATSGTCRPAKVAAISGACRPAEECETAARGS